MDARDKDLLDALRRQEPAALAEAYARHKDRIYGFLLRLSGRRDVAEDLFQETWIQLARHAHRLQDDTVLAAWLYTVARNQFRSHRRFRMIDSARLVALFRLHRDAPASPLEALSGQRAQAALERALGALGAGDRELLVLVGVEGLKPSEAASVLGISPEALRQRLSRARARLAERLASADRSARQAERSRE